MNGIVVRGWGAVSPAGWGVAALRQALVRGNPIEPKELPLPGSNTSLRVRTVPPVSPRPAFAAHARLRRTSPIAQYAVAAALEALGDDVAGVRNGTLRLGVILCMMCGCVNYSRRFYDETLRDPATASPLVFPETVFNAPASHLAALLGTTAASYTLVGDPGTYLQGLALGADWLLDEEVDGCLVVGAEEMDWLTADAIGLFDRRTILSEGAGALYLRREASEVTAIKLASITEPFLFTRNQSRERAAQRARHELGATGDHELLCDSLQKLSPLDRAEATAWGDWTGNRLSPKQVLGEGLMAAAAWQCVAAIDTLKTNGCSAANVSIVGCNQQAIAARFLKAPAPGSEAHQPQNGN